MRGNNTTPPIHVGLAQQSYKNGPGARSLTHLKEFDTIVLENMVGTTNEAIEKITQMLQGEMLAQLGNRLGCLEEGRREKPQQDKEGDEDEVNHDKNGKIDKIAI